MTLPKDCLRESCAYPHCGCKGNDMLTDEQCDERRAFEAWKMSTPGLDWITGPRLEAAWEAWQARAGYAARPVQEPVTPKMPSELLLLIGDPLMGPALLRFVNDVMAALKARPTETISEMLARQDEEKRAAILRAHPAPPEKQEGERS